MKITKQELLDLNVSETFLERFIEQTNNTDEPVDVADLVGGLNSYADLLCLLRKKINRERIVRFACDCALINIEKIKPYTDKYDLIVEFLKNPSFARDAVYAAAADASYSAAGAAAYAAYAAYAAAAYAAAYSAAAASAAAAGAASRAAGNSVAVNKLLIDMFNEF